MKSASNPNGSKPIAWLVGGGLWLAFCWSMLVGVKVPGFRDSAYLYYPLFEWLDSEWQSGEFPLWNPYCNFGMSNAGDNTTSMLYPGKAIFLFRFLDFPTRYGMYIALHLLWAGLGAYFLARTVRANIAGATLSAISYAAGGAVLTQGSNVIFLVSASWLPFALATVWKLIRTGEIRWAILAGATCAMMILGGDPQMVYHVGLIAAASIALRGFHERNRRRQTEQRSHVRANRTTMTRKRTVGLAVLVATTTLLAAVQVLPTYQWSKLSERTDSGQSLNLFQAVYYSIGFNRPDQPENASSAENAGANSKQQNPWTALLEPPRANTKAGNVYAFSLPPWSLIELLIPNASGKFMPVHQRWADGMAGPQGSPDRVWYPSIYLGWLTAWLSLGALTFRGRSPASWLSRIMLFFLLGSLGWYGLVWLLPIPGGGSQVGGVYWWLTTFLPGYSSFRYPAKLFVIASLCLCVLAGVRFNERSLNRINPFQSLLGWGLICGIGASIFAVATAQFDSLLDRVPSDPLFGPFDLSGAKRGLLFSLLHGLVLLALVGAILRMKGRGNFDDEVPPSNRSNGMSQATWLLVAITAVDLLVANYWILSLVPSSSFGKPIAITEKLIEKLKFLESERTTPVATPITIYRERDAYLPPAWQRKSSNRRMEEIIQWQRETLYPKHHLQHRVRLLGSFSSIQPRLYEKWFAELDTDWDAASICPTELERRHTDQQSLLHQLADGQLAGTPTETTTEAAIEIWRPEGNFVFFVRDETYFKTLRRTRIVDDSSNSSSTQALSSVVGGDQPEKLTSVDHQVTRFGCNRIEIAVTNDEACYLVHSCIHDGHWQAVVKSSSDGRPATQSLIEFAPGYQGIRLEPGQHQIELRYQPTFFWYAAYASGCSWIFLLGYLSIATIGRFSRTRWALAAANFAGKWLRVLRRETSKIRSGSRLHDKKS
jgi:hypothetical protein